MASASRRHCPPSLRVRSYRACFVTRGFPTGARRKSRPLASPAARPAQSALELGASPRWSRPASPVPRERCWFRRWSEASFTSVACSSPTFGARSALVASRRDPVLDGPDVWLEFPNDDRSFYSVLYQPALGALHALGPDSVHPSVRRCRSSVSATSCEAPPAEVGADRGSQLPRYRWHAAEAPHRPAPPLATPDAFVTVS